MLNNPVSTVYIEIMIIDVQSVNKYFRGSNVVLQKLISCGIIIATLYEASVEMPKLHK